MGSKYVDDLIDDDEVPELTGEDFAQMVPFSELPEDERSFYRSLKGATIRPDPARARLPVGLPADLVERFKAAAGDKWEDKMEAALRHWLVKHPPKLKDEHAKAS